MIPKLLCVVKSMCCCNFHFLFYICHVLKELSTALFQLETDSLNEHVDRIGLELTDQYTICRDNAVMNKDHLICRCLEPTKQNQKDIVGLYWKAKGWVA